MAKRLILSDLHFGDPLCSLRKKAVSEGLRTFLREFGHVDEIILAGDILDANISSLMLAIEGSKSKGKWPKQIGFRQWLSFLFEGSRFTTKRIIYMPGNHDYIIWNILSTNKAFVGPISEGKVPGDLPLMEDVFSDPFIAGVAPSSLRDKFIVSYPDYEFSLSRSKVLVTHGHYLDEKQTLFRNLEELIRKENGNEAEAIRKFFKGTAQYQAVANSVSYLKSTRSFVDITHKFIGGLFDIVGKLRNKPIDADMLEAIEMYLLHFRKKRPDIFIFGHTHRAARAKTSDFGRTPDKRIIKKVIDVWNDGSFIEDRRANLAGSFILTDDSNASKPVKCYKVDLKGNPTELDL
jgi:UDP-2,3-diacylglucosamine pyrophosphatase LpxH